MKTAACALLALLALPAGAETVLASDVQADALSAAQQQMLETHLGRIRRAKAHAGVEHRTHRGRLSADMPWTSPTRDGLLKRVWRWLKRQLQEQEVEVDWLERWLRELLAMPKSVADWVSRLAIATMIVLVLGLIVNEVRRGTWRRSPRTSPFSGDADARLENVVLTWQAVAALPPQDRPGAVLRLVLAAQSADGLTSSRDGHTHRQIAAEAERAGGAGEPLAQLARMAETGALRQMATGRFRGGTCVGARPFDNRRFRTQLVRDRLVTALGALLALAAVILVVLADHDPPPSRPTSVEPGPNGYRALRDWLHESGVNAVSHRHGWDALKDYGNGNLLIVTLPLQTRMREDEAGAMLPWVAEGNTLLLMAALNDTPDWSLAAPGCAPLKTIWNRSPLLRFEAAKAQDGQALEAGVLGEETRLDLAVVQAHPLAEGVDGLVGVTDAPASVWQVDAAPDEVRLRVAIATPHGTDAIWHVPFGRGDIFVSALGSLFTNRVIAQADNATLFANLVRHMSNPPKR